MTYGYSLPEIATQLDRNIKTIRAHKFNAMTKQNAFFIQRCLFD
jgi:DNA-binding NarL/FixJ family response regulator